jgi:hypothetical protein
MIPNISSQVPVDPPLTIEEIRQLREILLERAMQEMKERCESQVENWKLNIRVKPDGLPYHPSEMFYSVRYKEPK